VLIESENVMRAKDGDLFAHTGVYSVPKVGSLKSGGYSKIASDDTGELEKRNVDSSIECWLMKVEAATEGRAGWSRLISRL